MQLQKHSMDRWIDNNHIFIMIDEKFNKFLLKYIL